MSAAPADKTNRGRRRNGPNTTNRKRQHLEDAITQENPPMPPLKARKKDEPITLSSAVALLPAIKTLANDYFGQLMSLYKKRMHTREQLVKMQNETYVPRSIRVDFRLTGSDGAKKSIEYNALVAASKSVTDTYMHEQKELCRKVQTLELKIHKENIQDLACESIFRLGMLMYVWAVEHHEVRDEAKVHRFIFNALSDVKKQVLTYTFPDHGFEEFCDLYVKKFDSASTIFTRSPTYARSIPAHDNADDEADEDDNMKFMNNIAWQELEVYTSNISTQDENTSTPTANTPIAMHKETLPPELPTPAAPKIVNPYVRKTKNNVPNPSPHESSTDTPRPDTNQDAKKRPALVNTNTNNVNITVTTTTHGGTGMEQTPTVTTVGVNNNEFHNYSRNTVATAPRTTNDWNYDTYTTYKQPTTGSTNTTTASTQSDINRSNTARSTRSINTIDHTNDEPLDPHAIPSFRRLMTEMCFAHWDKTYRSLERAQANAAIAAFTTKFRTNTATNATAAILAAEASADIRTMRDLIASECNKQIKSQTNRISKLEQFHQRQAKNITKNLQRGQHSKDTNTGPRQITTTPHDSTINPNVLTPILKTAAATHTSTKMKPKKGIKTYTKSKNKRPNHLNDGDKADEPARGTKRGQSLKPPPKQQQESKQSENSSRTKKISWSDKHKKGSRKHTDA
jgi:hypothetical protein